MIKLWSVELIFGLLMFVIVVEVIVEWIMVFIMRSWMVKWFGGEIGRFIGLRWSMVRKLCMFMVVVLFKWFLF